jgi:murein biosynthesis integral membrane protein MurJ
VTTPPAEPGWDGNQEPDWYTGPLYDDTGWHIDLSDHDSRPEAASAYDPALGSQPSYGGNGGGPGDPGRDWTGDDHGQPAERPPGRHARPARPNQGYPPSSSPLARYSHPDPGYAPDQDPHGRADDPGYPDPADYPGSASPLARFSHPDQAGYEDYRDDYREPQDYRRYPDRRDYREPPRAPYAAPPPGNGPAGRYDSPERYEPPGQYVEPERYDRSSRYPEPGRHPAPGRHPEPGQYPEPGRYGEPGRYPEPERYPEPGRYPEPERYEAPDEYQPLDYSFLRVRQAGPQNPTLALPMTAGPVPPETGPIEVVRPDADRTGTGTASVMRSSGVMAVGTLASRLTGFLRTIAQSAALGAAGVAAAYNLSNTLPNVVYNLALGGILTSVIVPLIVNAKKRDADRGEAYEQRMFTLVTALLLGITVIATLAAWPIVHLYSGSSIAKSPSTQHLAVILAVFFIPQIFFYGVSSLIGAVLNTRGSFAAPMWTPVINNFVVIGVLGLYVAIAGPHRTVPPIPLTQVELLGLGTTLGIVAQTAALVPALRRVGFRWQPRADFRRGEVSEIGRMAGWMFCYIGATQVAFFVTTKLAGNVGPDGAGVTYYSYAWLLFQLPYAVVGISVITALLPRMSAHATERRFGLVRTDFSAGIRLSSALVVPCSLVLAVLGPPIAILFLGHGGTHIPQARIEGIVFSVFCLGLLPFTIFQLQLRVFYALHDSKTPALIGLATMSLNITANLVAEHLVPNRDLVAALGVGFGLANLLGIILAWRILSRRVGGLDGRAIGSSVSRMYAATVPAALLALFVSLLVDNVVSGPRFASIITIVLGGGGALLVYLLFAQALRITELTAVGSTLRSKLGR